MKVSQPSWVLLCLSASLLACEDGAITTEPGDAGIGAETDFVADDVEPPSPDVPQVRVPDTEPPDDTDDPGLCEAGTGCFEEMCDGPDDCNSGICVQHVGEKVCSKTCDEECPSGWTCNLVTGGSDGQYVCTSNFSHLCLPCSSAENCDGDTPNACVPYSDGGSFCGGSCDLSHACPAGYACQEVTTSTGGASYQCVAESGVCDCSSLAINSSAATPCFQENEHGICEGARVCSPDGLLACDAAEPGPEVCNGLDDDCDGDIDNETCDDGNPCTTDTCLGAEGCNHEPLDSGECLDGDVCTVADHCEAGVCVGTLVDCGDDNPCTQDSCDGVGGCINAPVVGVCDDGDACTLGDLCDPLGQCTGDVTLVCDDQNPCTDDSCGAQGCVHAPNSNPCDDQNACTTESVCSEGTCQAVTTLTCDDQNPCTHDTCDPNTGCGAVHNALPCDDQDACTLGDLCVEGACQSGQTLLACDDQNGCTDDACDPGLGCAFVANDNACDDGNDCTVMDTCGAGQCMGAGSLSCDDGNPCTMDSCMSDGGCAHQPSDGTCSDGDPCTLNDQCVQGQCLSGDALVCDDQNGCTDDSCEAELGCVFSANEQECEDGNECTNLDMCWEGICVAMGTIDCDDGNPCTADVCKPLEGCVHSAIDVPCSDGDPCTTADVCQDGSCVAGPLLSCDDGNPCTAEACTEGACVFDAQEGPCDDGSACTVGDHCEAGVCVLDSHLECDDEDVCTDDICEPSEGCTHTFNLSPCDDENVCTSDSTCDSGSCVGDDDSDCDDQNPCTTDSCDPVEGCMHTDNDLPCDDQSLCTTSSQCDQGDCVGDIDVFCDDGDGCTANECVPESGCVATPQACCGDGVTDPGEDCDDANQNNDDSCSNSCVSNGPTFHMNGPFYVSDDTFQGDFNAGGGFCTTMVGQTAYIAGNNASLSGSEPGGTWQGNGSSSHAGNNCMLYTTSSGSGYGTINGYGPCSESRHVVCSTDPAYCNGYGLQWCHLWD